MPVGWRRRPGAGRQLQVRRHHRCSSLVLLVAIVFVEQGQRRIPVTFAKRVVGRRMYGGQSTYIPLKVNQAGVIPIIFASSVLYFPVLLSNVLPSTAGARRSQNFINSTWSSRTTSVYIILYGAADHRLRLLLRGHHLRPPPAGRRSSANRVGTSRASGRDRRPSATCSRSSTGSPCPARCSWRSSPCCPSLFLAFWNITELPLRRDDPAHRRRCRPRDDEADRQPADDAELRGLPQVVVPGARLVILGKQGAGKGTQCVRLSRALRRAAHLDRRHVPGGRALGRRSSASRPRRTWTPAS